MNIRSKTYILFFLSVSLGVLIWFLSPLITGKVEPWDADNAYYIISLIGAGILMGVSGPQRFWLWPIAIYLGQCAYIILYSVFRPIVGVNFFFPIGMISLAIATVLSLIGSAVGAGLRILAEKLRT